MTKQRWGYDSDSIHDEIIYIMSKDARGSKSSVKKLIFVRLSIFGGEIKMIYLCYTSA